MLIKSSAASETKQRVTIKYSPIIEIASSLRCLAQHDPCPTFLEPCQLLLDSMNDKRRNDFQHLCELSLDWSLAIDLFCHFEQHDIESARDLFATFASLSTVDFSYGMLSGLVPKKTIARLLRQPEKISAWHDQALDGFIDAALAQNILREAEALQDQMADFLQWYWEGAFQQSWHKIGAAEIANVRIENDILTTLGESGYLETCHPSVKVIGDAVTIIDAPQYCWSLRDIESIDILITAFSDSHLIVNKFGDTLTIFKRVTLGNLETKEVGLEELAEFLKAISSSTKFQILEELYKAPKTTKELAEALDMAPSSISEHLKTLRAAELLYPQRVKNSVYNRFLYENYQAFASKLLSYFDH